MVSCRCSLNPIHWQSFFFPYLLESPEIYIQTFVLRWAWSAPPTSALRFIQGWCCLWRWSTRQKTDHASPQFNCRIILHRCWCENWKSELELVLASSTAGSAVHSKRSKDSKVNWLVIPDGSCILSILRSTDWFFHSFLDDHGLMSRRRFLRHI